MSASLLIAEGLGDTVARSFDDYVTIATALARQQVTSSSTNGSNDRPRAEDHVGSAAEGGARARLRERFARLRRGASADAGSHQTPMAQRRSQGRAVAGGTGAGGIFDCAAFAERLKRGSVIYYPLFLLFNYSKSTG